MCACGLRWEDRSPRGVRCPPFLPQCILRHLRCWAHRWTSLPPSEEKASATIRCLRAPPHCPLSAPQEPGLRPLTWFLREPAIAPATSGTATATTALPQNLSPALASITWALLCLNKSECRLPCREVCPPPCRRPYRPTRRSPCARSSLGTRTAHGGDSAG